MSEELDRARRRHGIAEPSEPLTDEERLRRAGEFLRDQHLDPARERARQRFGVEASA